MKFFKYCVPRDTALIAQIREASISYGLVILCIARHNICMEHFIHEVVLPDSLTFKLLSIPIIRLEVENIR